MMQYKILALFKGKINLLSSILLLSVIVWGIKVIIIEGFLLAGKRKWAGDFSSAFYDEIYWRDDGYMYGPVFTLVKAISNEFPNLFRIEIFALGNILIFVATLAVIWKLFEIQTLMPLDKLTALALVVTFSHLYYAFSVSAFPEFLELFLICLCFLLLKKNYLKLSMIVLGIATMVKIVPIILLPFLFSIVGLSGLLVFLGTVTFFVTTLVLYLDINYFQATYKVFEITTRGSRNIYHPESTEHLGLSSAIGRLEISLFSNSSTPIISVVVIVIVYIVALKTTQILSHQINRQQYIEFLLAITSTLIPFVSSASHRHSFIFLIPIAFLIVKRNEKIRKSALLIVFLIISIPFYSILNINFNIGRYLYHEPIIANLILLFVMMSFGFKHVKRVI